MAKANAYFYGCTLVILCVLNVVWHNCDTLFKNCDTLFKNCDTLFKSSAGHHVGDMLVLSVTSLLPREWLTFIPIL